MSDMVIKKLDVETDLASFEVWLIEHINRNYSSVFKIKSLHPLATPWELERNGIDVWKHSNKYSLSFARHSLLTSWKLGEPTTINFDMTQQDLFGIHIEISAPKSDDPYLNDLITDIIEHWRSEIIEEVQPTLEEKSLSVLRYLYNEVGDDTAVEVDVKNLVEDEDVIRDELLSIVYYLVGQGWCKRVLGNGQHLKLRITPAGLDRIKPPMLSHSEIEIHIDYIDSFSTVKDVQPGDVTDLIPLDLSEDQVQTFFEEIIGENFHQQDWGGEMNDLVTSHLRVNGQRLRAVFLLKGNGTPGKLTIKKCGQNGDQIVRLVEAPVDLYIIQHVDEIDQRVIYDLRSKVELKNRNGHQCYMCIIDGTDTARILKAYGKI